MSMIATAGAAVLGGQNKPGAGLLTGGFVAAGSVMKAFTIIPQGEMGVRTHFKQPVRTRGPHAGELYGTVGRGWHWIVPFTHGIKTISIQDRFDNLEHVFVNSNEGRQIEINPSIAWGVRADNDNPFRALFIPKDEEALVTGVKNLCTAGISEVLDGRSKEEMKDRRTVYPVSYTHLTLPTT